MAGLVGVTLGVLSLALVCTIALTVVGVRYRDVPGARWFGATMGTVSLWIVVALLLVLVDDFTVLRHLNVVGTVFTQITPVLWLCFVLAYTGREAWLTWPVLALLFVVPVLTATAVSTNPLHSLYHTNPHLVSLGPDTQLFATDPGPLAYLVLFYAGLLFVVGLSIVVQMLIEDDRLFSGQAAWLLIGSLAPIAVAFLSGGGVVPAGVPLLSASFSLTGLAYGYGLFRHRLLDFTPATRRIGTREAFDNLNDGLVIVDTSSAIAAINESARRQFDCVDQSVLGRPLASLDPAFEGFSDTSSIDIERGGEWYEITVSTIEDSRSRPTGHALVVRDVTLSRSRKQRLEVLNRVLRHNLRNDMTVIQGYAEILDEDDDTGMADAILGTTTGLLELAEKARDIEQTLGMETVTAVSVSLTELLDAIVTEYRTRYPTHTITFDAPPDLTVSTDPAVVELIVENLVENALEHHPTTAPGDTATDGGAMVHVGVETDDDGVTILVRDDGDGIPANELRVIRDGEESPLEHGSGLGLWLAQWCTTRIGGNISFETTDGTTVRIWLPSDEDRDGSSTHARNN